MGVESLVDDIPFSEVPNEEVTLAHLEHHYNEEIVRRGLKYMSSLNEADEEYRKSASDNSDEYAKNIREGLIGEGGDIDGDGDEDVAEGWKSSMEESGLGLDDG